MIFIPLSASACALPFYETRRNRGSAALASKRKISILSASSLIVGVAMETCPSWIIRCGLALSALRLFYPNEPTFIVRFGMSQT